MYMNILSRSLIIKVVQPAVVLSHHKVNSTQMEYIFLSYYHLSFLSI